MIYFNHFALEMILLTILQNVAFYLFNYYDNFLKRYISILQGKSSFLVLNDFTKYFSETRINEILNKCLNS